MLTVAVAFINAIVFVVTFSGIADAQSSAPRTPGFELLIPTGAVVPTGTHDIELERARMTAVQGFYGLRPDLVLTATVGWARTRPQGVADARVNIFNYDAGAECRVPRRVGDGRITVKPFTGMGLGARSITYGNLDVANAHNFAAYVSGGGDMTLVKIRLRLEVRDYLTWPDAPAAADRVRRNDIAFLIGVRLGVR